MIKQILVILMSGIFLWGGIGKAEMSNEPEAALEIGNKPIDLDTLQFLELIKSDIKAAIVKTPKKYDKDGIQELDNNEFLKSATNESFGKKLDEFFQLKKAQFQKKFGLYEGTLETFEDVLAQAKSEFGGRRKERENDLAENLVWNGGDNSYIDKIENMQRLTEGKVDIQPWSSDYWAIATGVTAKRYADPSFPKLATSGMVWHDVNAYWNKWFVSHGADPDAFIDQMSPAEKYDILVGDSKFTLTQSQIAEGRSYAFEANGKKKAVETWMGICHGWATAAYMYERPKNFVVAHSPSGYAINFYIDDIKALAVLKWANGEARVKNGNSVARAMSFVGGRCNIQAAKVKTDTKTGAIMDPDCFDTNPGSWHKAVVNQVGVLKKSFVIDATFDYQVWNQPILSYKYTYFDPMNMKPVKTLSQATKPFGFSGDKFKEIRLQNYIGREKPANIVGVIMELTYLVERLPMEKKKHDTPDQDALRTVRYVYDLELDANGKIIGGEWYENQHPDFMWTPAENAFAWNDIDASIGANTKYNPQQSMDKKIAKVAINGAVYSQPLKVIVEGLIQAAQ